MAILNEVRKTKNFRSLSTTLIVSFLILSLIILLLGSGLGMYFSFQTQQKFLISQQQLISKDAAGTVKNFIQEKFGILERSITIGSLEAAGPKEQKLVLDKLLGKVPSFRQLILLNAQGQTLVKASRLSESVSGKLIKQVGGDLFSQVSQKQTYISQVYVDDTTQEPMVAIAVPITNVFRDFKGTLLAEVNLKFMWDLMNTIRVGDKGFAYVVDKEGNLIAFGDISRVLKRENLAQLEEVGEFIHNNEKNDINAAVISKGIKNAYVSTTYAPLGTPDWAVIVELPVFEAYQPIIYQILLTVSITLLIFGITAISTIYLSKRITKPVKELTITVQAIAGGDLTKRAEIESEDEIGQLAMSFNEMVEDVLRAEKEKRALAEKSAEELTKKVDERTSELQSKIKELDESRLILQSLAEDIQKEKEGVEQKVETRTYQLVQEQARLQASINSLPVGFVITDTKDNIVTMNGIAKSILCLKSKNHSAGVVTKENLEHLDCDLNEMQERLKGNLDIKLAIDKTIEDKKPFEVKELALDDLFLHIFIAPVITMEKENFSVIGAVILVENITERKIIERSRDEFFSIASHELRTPLTAIKGNTSMILDYFGDQLKNPQMREMIDDVHESSVRLISIVNDFLDTSRLELGKMEFKKEIFELPLLISDAIKTYQVTGSRKKLYINFENIEKVPSVVADKDRVRQVLINLIGNGLKFTEKGGITVSLKIEGNFVKILASDTGMGISSKNQSLLFRKFQQAESNIFTRDTVAGTGLGLYISKLMVEGMGGRIKLESSVEGKGTTFSFTLPVATQADISVAKAETAKIKVDFHAGPAMNTDKTVLSANNKNL